MKTSDLIQNLSVDLKPTRGGDSLKVFLAKWFSVTLVIIAISLLVMPFRFDLKEQVSNPMFYLELGFWFASSLMIAIVVYQSSIPGVLKRMDSRWAYLPLMLLGMIVLARFPTHGIRQEALQEMTIYRGGCGAVIWFTGLISAALFCAWARKSAAPTQPRLTAIGVALSAGSLASFIMQFICPYENSLHLLIWHFTPVVLLTWVGATLGRKVLRW